MSTNLYLLFEPAQPDGAYLPQLLQGMAIPGYSFWDNPLKNVINVPGEPDVPARCLFYADNYFRIHISDLVIQFCRESMLPSELVTI